MRMVWTAALLVAAALGACSRDEPRARVAARVNGEAISIDRLRHTLAEVTSAEGAASVSAPTASALIEREIDRALLAQKARQIHLERDRLVAAAIDAATTGILAQAYLERALGLSADELRQRAAYYREHPTLFAERRIFYLLELSVAAPESRLAQIRKRAARARGLHEMAAWLKTQGLPYGTGSAQRATEDLAPDTRAKLSTMKDGQIAVVRMPGGASILQLLRSEHAPVSEADAAAGIDALLLSRRRAEVAERELAHLRRSAKIEYLVDLDGPSAANRRQR